MKQPHSVPVCREAGQLTACLVNNLFMRPLLRNSPFTPSSAAEWTETVHGGTGVTWQRERCSNRAIHPNPPTPPAAPSAYPSHSVHDPDRPENATVLAHTCRGRSRLVPRAWPAGTLPFAGRCAATGGVGVADRAEGSRASGMDACAACTAEQGGRLVCAVMPQRTCELVHCVDLVQALQVRRTFGPAAVLASPASSMCAQNGVCLDHMV